VVQFVKRDFTLETLKAMAFVANIDPEEVEYLYHERAGILEFDGGLAKGRSRAEGFRRREVRD